MGMTKINYNGSNNGGCCTTAVRLLLPTTTTNLNHQRQKTTLDVQICRDGPNCPWGIRLKGGRDVDGGSPLEIVKVSLGTPCEGILYPGDTLITINHTKSSHLTHLEALALFKVPSSTISLTVSRAPTEHFRSVLGESNNTRRGSLATKKQSVNTALENISRVHPIVKSASLNGYTDEFSLTKLEEANTPITDIHTTKEIRKSEHTLLPNPHDMNYNSQSSNNSPSRAMSYSRAVPITVSGGRGISSTTMPMSPTYNPRSSNPPSIQNPYREMNSSPHPTSPLPFHKQFSAAHPQKRTTTGYHHNAQLSPQNNPYPHASKVVNINGNEKEVVSAQYNSPIKMYSDQSLMEVGRINQNCNIRGNPTVGGVGHGHGPFSANNHPGYVESSRPHLPTPNGLVGGQAQPSETFKMILENEMNQAKQQPGVVGANFLKPPNGSGSRPSSSMSNRSNPDPVLLDQTIPQSLSFKRLMQSVLSADTDV